MNIDLQRLYGQSAGPVAFLDESYELQGTQRFYILACAVIRPDELVNSRQALLGLPDLLAWSYRQGITVSDSRWFAPFEALARIHLI